MHELGRRPRSALINLAITGEGTGGLTFLLSAGFLPFSGLAARRRKRFLSAATGACRRFADRRLGDGQAGWTEEGRP